MDAPLENPVKKPKKKSPELIKILGAAAMVIAACGISFFAGSAYQKKQATNFSTKYHRWVFRRPRF